MNNFLILCFMLTLVGHGAAKIFRKCDLAAHLKNKHQFTMDEVKNWVCIAEFESTFNTAAINSYTKDYGLFQISSLFWCGDDIGKNVCRKKCEDFLDDDLTDDIVCAKRIKRDTERWTKTDNGLVAWVAYVNKCQYRNLDTYISECKDALAATTTPATTTTLATTEKTTTKKPTTTTIMELHHHQPVRGPQIPLSQQQMPVRDPQIPIRRPQVPPPTREAQKPFKRPQIPLTIPYIPARRPHIPVIRPQIPVRVTTHSPSKETQKIIDQLEFKPEMPVNKPAKGPPIREDELKIPLEESELPLIPMTEQELPVRKPQMPLRRPQTPVNYKPQRKSPITRKPITNPLISIRRPEIPSNDLPDIQVAGMQNQDTTIPVDNVGTVSENGENSPQKMLSMKNVFGPNFWSQVPVRPHFWGMNMGPPIWSLRLFAIRPKTTRYFSPNFAVIPYEIL